MISLKKISKQKIQRKIKGKKKQASHCSIFPQRCKGPFGALDLPDPPQPQRAIADASISPGDDRAVGQERSEGTVGEEPFGGLDLLDTSGIFWGEAWEILGSILESM